VGFFVESAEFLEHSGADAVLSPGVTRESKCVFERSVKTRRPF